MEASASDDDDGGSPRDVENAALGERFEGLLAAVQGFVRERLEEGAPPSRDAWAQLAREALDAAVARSSGGGGAPPRMAVAWGVRGTRVVAVVALGVAVVPHELLWPDDVAELPSPIVLPEGASMDHDDEYERPTEEAAAPEQFQLRLQKLQDQEGKRPRVSRRDEDIARQRQQQAATIAALADRDRRETKEAVAEIRRERVRQEALAPSSAPLAPSAASIARPSAAPAVPIQLSRPPPPPASLAVAKISHEAEALRAPQLPSVARIEDIRMDAGKKKRSEADASKMSLAPPARTQALSPQGPPAPPMDWIPEQHAAPAQPVEDGEVRAELAESEAAPDEAESESEDSQAAIDELFADLETVVKYMGMLLFRATQRPRSVVSAIPVVVGSVLAVIVATVVCIVIVLPTFYAVLVVRMMKVEVSKESFVKRAAIIAQETVAKHSLRLARLFMRSLPLSLLLVAFPLVMLFAVIPRLDSVKEKRDAGFATCVVYVAIIMIFQIQGTTRAVITFRTSEAARLTTHVAATKTIQVWWRARMAGRAARQQRRLRPRPSRPGAGIGIAVAGGVGIGVGVTVGVRGVPDVDVPAVAVPDVDVPDISSIRVPAAPDVDVPNVPSIGVPDVPVDIPDVDVPDIPPRPDWMRTSPFGVITSVDLPSAPPIPALPPAEIPDVPTLPCVVAVAVAVPRLPRPPPLPAVVALYRNLSVYLSLAVEALQLASLGLKAVPPRFTADFWIDTNLLPALFLQFPDPYLGMMWGACGLVAATVLLVVGRMLYEVRRYEALRAGAHFGCDDDEDADEFFFFSFVGSVLYGHGNPKGVPAPLCTLVSLSCDVLFFSLLTNLGAAMTCFDPDDGNFVSGTPLVCWGTGHRVHLTAALISFGYFVPLSIMVAPVLAEANKSVKSGCVTTSKPYLMIINVAKALVAMFTVLVSRRALPAVIAAVTLALFVAVLTAAWSARSDFTQPVSQGSLNKTRISCAVGGLLCSSVALLTVVVPEIRSPYRYVAVGVSFTIFCLILPVFFAIRR